eukprot:1189636-Prorocentrum_minimum.AAC.4
MRGLMVKVRHLYLRPPLGHPAAAPLTHVLLEEESCQLLLLRPSRIAVPPGPLLPAHVRLRCRSLLSSAVLTPPGGRFIGGSGGACAWGADNRRNPTLTTEHSESKGEIEHSESRGRLNIRSPRGRLNIRSPRGRLNIRSPRGRLNIRSPGGKPLGHLLAAFASRPALRAWWLAIRNEVCHEPVV